MVVEGWVSMMESAMKVEKEERERNNDIDANKTDK
jgi:hypothetical protein